MKNILIQNWKCACQLLNVLSNEHQANEMEDKLCLHAFECRSSWFGDEVSCTEYGTQDEGESGYRIQTLSDKIDVKQGLIKSYLNYF